MIVQQFFVRGIAHSSYLVGGSKHCAVIDPERHVEVYLRAARELGLRITHILETHLHADFLSGHLELAAATGAAIYAPKAGDCLFDHVPVAEGDEFDIDDMHVRVLETPGHTPEHVTYVVADRARGSDPVGIFCGDTLFVGDVGRPDLFPGRAKELAGALFDSLHKKLLALPDFCEVWPAHGAGSLCGRAMGAKRTSTLGYERGHNAALRILDRNEFIRSLTTHMPPAPDHFARCSDINRRGPEMLAALPSFRGLAPADFRDETTRPDRLVLDVRRPDAFGGQHVPGALSIDLTGNFATFAGWILPPQARVLLVVEQEDQVREAALGLRRVGVDHVTGWLDGGMSEWAKAGFDTSHVPQLSAGELAALATKGGKGFTILDVRSPGEYGAMHIKGAVHIPVSDLRHRAGELDPSLTYALVCSTGHRSSLAASLLQRQGFGHVLNLAGGMTGYAASGHIAECPLCVVPHGPRFSGSASKEEKR